MKWGSASGRLPSPWASSTSKGPAPRNGISQLIVALLESMISCLKGRLGNGIWQTKLTSMVRNSRQHWTRSGSLVFAEGRIGSKTLRLRRGNTCILVWIFLPRCFLCSSWWCADTEDDVEETSGYRFSPIKVCCNHSTDFLVDMCTCTITYVNSDIAGKRVGEIIT